MQPQKVAGCAWCCVRPIRRRRRRCWPEPARSPKFLAAHRNAALHFLRRAGRDSGEPGDPPAAFLEHFVPSDLVVSTVGGYVPHLAARDATWFMDGYWPSMQFAADDVPIAWVCES